MSKWIRFEEVKDTGKTKVWCLWSKNDGTLLGEVKWYGAWRQYTFHTHSDWNTVWNAECLADLTRFVENKNQQHRLDRKQKKLDEQTKLVHLDDRGEDGPACGAGVGYVARWNEPGTVTCEKCLEAIAW